ncbi:MAG TPA: hypothetical protein PKE55_11420 [Kiritimatiellia bacterium]|nr:hypothetical protein [Kiritimatiellia bacterium]
MNLDHAIINKQVWKSDIIDDYVTALLTSALDLLRRGVVYFNNDDVDEAFQPGDKTTVGAAIKALAIANIIEPWRGSDPAREIFGGMRRSSRPCCNGHRNQLYTLKHVASAQTWLKRHGRNHQPLQLELF